MRLFALNGTHVLGQAVADAIDAELDVIEEREFADGEHKARPLVSVRNEDVYVVQSLHGRHGQLPSDRLLRLLFFLATCRDNGARRVTAVVPYMAFMRKEQQTKPRDPVTSRYVAALFEAVGPDMVVTLEVHNPAAFQNAFRCRTTHLDARHLFAAEVAELAAGGRVIFLSPDSGGMRRAHLMHETYCAEGDRKAGFAMMEKHRSEGIVSGELFAGDVENAEVFIVDDMIATGGTVLRAADACRRRGAKHVYVLATHGLFSSGSSELFSGSSIDRLVVSDSVAPFQVSPAETNGRLKIVTCAGLLGDAIRHLHGGGSIHPPLNPQP
ncbi:MAG: ribose-phosphate diphosphokinase [Devosia sp.]|nr:ribose-phosphate diphosphokinase [Devosia sp.]